MESDLDVEEAEGEDSDVGGVVGRWLYTCAHRCTWGREIAHRALHGNRWSLDHAHNNRDE